MRALLPMVIMAAALGLHPAFGQDTAESLAQAMDMVQQASGDAGNKPDDVERIRLLTQAIALTKNAPMHNLKGHRVLAIEDMRVGIQLIRDGDPKSQLSGYIHNAISELKASIALAEENAAAQPSDAPPAPVPTPAPPPAPIEPVTNAAATPPPGDALPPGVTADMEKDFVARYEAAMKTAKASKDPSGLAAYFALVASDPKIDPEGKKAFEDLMVFSVGFDAMGSNATYQFVPVKTEGTKAEDKPLQLAGKMYQGYLPPVVAMKVTFAPPEHPDPNGINPTGATHPLCVENGKLMFIGVKVIPGAVPPPIDNPAENFGLTPNHLAKGDLDDDNDFASLDKFLAALKHPSVQVLGSGQNANEYYALCRVKPDLLVFVHNNRPGKNNYSYTFLVTDSNQTQVKSGEKQITLAENTESLDGKPIPIVQGDVYNPNAGYAGSITVLGKYGITSDPKKPDPSDPVFTFTKTVDWK